MTFFRLDLIEELKRSSSVNGFNEKNETQGEDEITLSRRQNLDPVFEKWSNKYIFLYSDRPVKTFNLKNTCTI